MTDEKRDFIIGVFNSGKAVVDLVKPITCSYHEAAYLVAALEILAKDQLRCGEYYAYDEETNRDKG